ncbi:MAG: PepSY domain-containing protein [Hyphomicrobiales bacterium]|nr:PepSY domain-containing protein [Hyphomicrobiales bacterium]
MTFTARSSSKLHLIAMRPAGVSFLFLLALAGPAPAQPASRACFSAAEAREKIAAEKLAEPFTLMRGQAADHHAEAIGVRLCDGAAGPVYEIELLKKDGRLIHTIVDAATGKPVNAPRK